MADLAELQKQKDTLAALDKELEHQANELEVALDAIREQFAAKTAELEAQRAKLANAYANALRSELKSVERVPKASSGTNSRRSRTGVDTEAVVGALRRAHGEIPASRIRELASIPETVSANTLSVALSRLVESGQVAKTGEKRGTKYRTV
jgi:chromosome segregation ATPase